MRITRRLEFDAGHRIPNHDSQCRHLHGHRYALEVTLSGNPINVPGASSEAMVMDFSDVKAIAQRVIVDAQPRLLPRLDGQHLAAQGVHGDAQAVCGGVKEISRRLRALAPAATDSLVTGQK